MRKFPREHVSVRTSACLGVHISRWLWTATPVTGVNYHPPQNRTPCLIRNLTWESPCWFWKKRPPPQPSSSAYNIAPTSHYYQVATEEYNTIFFSASNYGIMRLDSKLTNDKRKDSNVSFGFASSICKNQGWGNVTVEDFNRLRTFGFSKVVPKYFRELKQNSTLMGMLRM